MSNRPIVGVLVNATQNRIYKTTLDGTLDGFYNALECTCFDIATRRIAGKYYDIYCDDEGLLKEHPKVTAISSKGEPMLVGNLFICLHDEEGDTVSLDEHQIDRILDNVRMVITMDMKVRPVLICEY